MQLPTQGSLERPGSSSQRGAHHASDRRYNKRVKVDMLINRFLNGQPYMCRMVDISRTGAGWPRCIEPERQPGTELHGPAVPASGSERHPDGVRCRR